MNNLITAVLVGPTGAGKSQFCNFVQKDISNSKNEVNHGLKSCTKDAFQMNSKETEQNMISLILQEVQILMIKINKI